MAILKQNLKLDEWQEQVLKTDGNVCLMSGRQVGKSSIWAVDAAEWAVKHPNKVVLMIASVERQAFLLFEKTLDYLLNNYKSKVRMGKDRPTKSMVKLTNGTRILCLPTGLDGHGIRGLTVHRLYGDEAAFIPDDVWTAVTPMLAMTGGVQRLSSTPHGAEGYFYTCFMDKKGFKTFHVETEQVVKERKFSDTWTEFQKKAALEHIRREKARMSKLQFAQEYLGRPISGLRQVFPDELIKKVMTLRRRGTIIPNLRYYMGVDIARMGEDESTFEIMDRTNPKLIKHVEHQVTTKTLTTETTKQIIALDKLYDCKQIFVDDGGMGVGVFDQLLDTEQTRRKTVAINNAARPLTHEEKQKKKVIKEDIYNNLLALMERNEIQLLNDAEIFQSLKSVQFEIVNGRVKYFGNYTHIADGLVRAAWGVKDKSLNIYLY
jgi:hypothetical protein